MRKLKWYVCVATGKMCKIFPRTRWVGWDESIDWIGVFTAVHQLLPIVYRLWYTKVSGRKLPPLPMAGAADASAFDAILLDDVHPQPGGADDAQGPHEQAVPEYGPNVVDAPTVQEESKDTKHKQLDRNVAVKFVSLPQLGDTSAALRMGCAPVFSLMHDSLQNGWRQMGTLELRFICERETAGVPRP